MDGLELKYLFPTPIWDTKIKGYGILNQKLKKHIYSLKNNNPQGEQFSNVLGWHSKQLDFSNPEINGFLVSIIPFLNKALTDLGCDLNNFRPNIQTSWAIINPKNATMVTHIHPESTLSIAYYVKAQKDSGNFITEDPRSGTQFNVPPTDKINMLNMRKIEIEPEEGLLIIFPSYLPHLVGPNKTEEDRIVISMNIDLIPNE